MFYMSPDSKSTLNVCSPNRIDQGDVGNNASMNGQAVTKNNVLLLFDNLFGYTYI